MRRAGGDVRWAEQATRTADAGERASADAGARGPARRRRLAAWWRADAEPAPDTCGEARAGETAASEAAAARPGQEPTGPRPPAAGSVAVPGTTTVGVETDTDFATTDFATTDDATDGAAATGTATPGAARGDVAGSGAALTEGGGRHAAGTAAAETDAVDTSGDTRPGDLDAGDAGGSAGPVETGPATAASAPATGPDTSAQSPTGTASTGTASTGTASTGTASTGTASTGTASADAGLADLTSADTAPAPPASHPSTGADAPPATPERPPADSGPATPRHRRTSARQAARAALAETRRPHGARRAAGRVPAVLAFLVVAAVTVGAHVLTALFALPRAASVAEARLAVAALAVRGSDVAGGPLGPFDRFAALQVAAVQLLLPHGDPADTARWACLALGALTALLLWPTLRRLSLSTASTTVAVSLFGAALPVLTLQAGVTAAAPAALWLTLAGALVARDRGRVALVVALVAVATAPLAALPLLGLAAHVVLGRTVQVPAPRLVGGLAAIAAIAVGGLAVVDGGLLAGSGGPAVDTPFAVVAAVVALALLAAAAAAERWVRPVMTGGGLLVLVALVPGPSRVAAFLLAAPLVATAVAIVVERAGRPLRVVAVVLAAALVAVPTAVVAAGLRPAAPRAPLAAWIATQTTPDTVVVADPLDRVALLDAGVAAGRLRDPADAAVPGELRLVSSRPGGAERPCPPGLLLASTARGTGDAAGQVCATDAPAEGAAARARFGTALADNPALTLAPAAAAVLRAGDVDTRLMLTLAALSGAHRVGVGDFPPVALDVAGSSRRQMVLTTFDGASASSSALLRTWLSAQQEPFTPGTVSPGVGGSLVIGYPVPAPAGLLPS